MTDSAPVLASYAEGMAFLKMRDHLAQAEAAFRAGLAAEPDHEGCLLQLGTTLRVLGRLKQAAAMLGRALALAPDNPEIHQQIGRVRFYQKLFPEALAAYDAALALDPRHVQARIQRALTLQEMHCWTEALGDYDKLISDLPPELSTFSELPRRRAEVAGRLARIAEYGIDPTRPRQDMAVALYRQASRLVQEDALDAAVLLYEDAASLAPDYGDPAMGVGGTVPVYLARRPSGDYLSCPWIEEGLHFHEYQLGFCCTAHHGHKGWAMIGTYHGGPLPIDFILARRLQLIRQNQAGADNKCLGCHELERRAWPARPGLLGKLIINSYSICNMKCTYCSLAIAHFEMPAYYYLAEPAIDSLVANGWLSPGAQATWGGGEPSVSKEFQQITSKLLAAGCSFDINTNATRAVPAIEEALRLGRCSLAISVDSGTPETFYRVKYDSDHPVTVHGRPAFDVVWETIARYAELSRESVVVKYIFMPTTTGEADLQGFVDLCLAHGVGRVMLTPEFSDVSAGDVPRSVWDAINRTRALAEANGLVVLFNPLDPSNASMPAGM